LRSFVHMKGVKIYRGSFFIRIDRQQIEAFVSKLDHQFFLNQR